MKRTRRAHAAVRRAASVVGALLREERDASTRCSAGSMACRRATYSCCRRAAIARTKLWHFNCRACRAPPSEERLKVMRDFVTLARTRSQFGHMPAKSRSCGDSPAWSATRCRTRPSTNARKCSNARSSSCARAGLGVHVRHDTTSELRSSPSPRRGASPTREKKGEKRKADAGYDPNAKGIDSLVMPGAKPDRARAAVRAARSWENDLDYGPKGRAAAAPVVERVDRQGGPRASSSGSAAARSTWRAPGPTSSASRSIPAM
jgi:hypothetical protein